jgi:hypothetical protein
MFPTLEEFLIQHGWRPKFKRGSTDRRWYQDRSAAFAVDEETAIAQTYQHIEELESIGIFENERTYL